MSSPKRRWRPRRKPTTDDTTLAASIGQHFGLTRAPCSRCGERAPLARGTRVCQACVDKITDRTLTTHLKADPDPELFNGQQWTVVEADVVFRELIEDMEAAGQITPEAARHLRDALEE